MGSPRSNQSSQHTPVRSGCKNPARPGPSSYVTAVLQQGDVVAGGYLPMGSNVICLTKLRLGDNEVLAIYKPRDGESPLVDFAGGTLYRRERAAYLLSTLIGWPQVPTTVIRQGPLGVGSFQLFVHANFDRNYFTLGQDKDDELRAIALFDVVANNADRKAGHFLLDEQDSIWVVDHGLTLHETPKLRTVIWDFSGQHIPNDLLADLRVAGEKLKDHLPASAEIRSLLSPAEFQALCDRISQVLMFGRYPEPGPLRHYPWPPI
jgi:uncharacterized repeat protein (TIGR03843 family)